VLPEALRNRIETVESDSERQTRQIRNIVSEFRKTMSAQKSVFYGRMKMYDSLPAMRKQIESSHLSER